MTLDNWVNGELGDVKTPKSRRDLKMCNTLFTLFKRLQKQAYSEFVFTHKGKPLNTHFVSTQLWYPTLNKAGLARRRPYETRHTAAVLHIAAHENPLYISHMLGHSDTRLLFELTRCAVNTAILLLITSLVPNKARHKIALLKTYIVLLLDTNIY